MQIPVCDRLITIFDSGLGGLTVYRELRKLAVGAATVYVADDAAFPYGRLAEDVLLARVMEVASAAIALSKPDVFVVACNTASTLVLPHLRERYPQIDFVGTVPAVKPAAEKSRSHMITVLGTAATVRRDYTRALVEAHAAHCSVQLVGSERLAGLAERFVHGLPVPDEDIVRELAPCFVEAEGRRTDHIVLACTHYPLLRARMEQLAGTAVGWPVEFVDPAEAIARRAVHVLSLKPARTGSSGPQPRHQVWTTGGDLDEPALRLYASFGLVPVDSISKCDF